MAQMRPTRRTLIIQTTLSDPHTLCCTLEDSGPGIKPEHLDRLFDSFFTTKDAGMGLGLPISRSIIEAHGGYMRVDNESAYAADVAWPPMRWRVDRLGSGKGTDQAHSQPRQSGRLHTARAMVIERMGGHGNASGVKRLSMDGWSCHGPLPSTASSMVLA
jgi:signal transduction histidine kinase